MTGDLKNLEKLFKTAIEEIPEKTKSIVEVETLRFVGDNFQNEAFDTGSGNKKWPERKQTDRKGRDITRYRTGRRGKRGSLNKYGRSIKGRALLVGHGSGGKKLRNSYRAVRMRNAVAFRTYKKYAQRHNEGKDGMAERRHIGPSKALDRRYHRQLTKQLNKIFNN